MAPGSSRGGSSWRNQEPPHPLPLSAYFFLTTYEMLFGGIVQILKLAWLMEILRIVLSFEQSKPFFSPDSWFLRQSNPLKKCSGLLIYFQSISYASNHTHFLLTL